MITIVKLRPAKRLAAASAIFLNVGLLYAGGATAQSVVDGASDSSYLSSLDDMALNMDLGSIATETYDTIIVEAPQLSDAKTALGDMDCATLKDWMAKHSADNGVLSGVDWAGQDYQAALTACAFPAPQALALATRSIAGGS